MFFYIYTKFNDNISKIFLKILKEKIGYAFLGYSKRFLGLLLHIMCIKYDVTIVYAWRDYKLFIFYIYSIIF